MITNKTKLRFFLIFLLFVSMMTLTSCKLNKGNDRVDKTKNNDFISNSAFKLNTIVTITIYDSKDESLLEDCFKLCDDYEAIYSKTLPSSELYLLNSGLLPHDNGFQISNELNDLLESGLYYSYLANGSFDISIAPLTSLWDFNSITPVIPPQGLIEQALEKVNYKDIILENNKLSFAKEGMSLDLGAIAKGYIADRIKEYLLSQGVNSAMINLGGNVLTIGQKVDGSAYKIGIQKPFADRNELAAIIELKDLSVVSSGIYERSFQIDGKFYHHILNPKTGFSYENSLIAVTIISKNSVDGDGLSTVCFSLGLSEGMDLINGLENTYAVFITDDYKLHYSEGFEDAIPISIP